MVVAFEAPRHLVEQADRLAEADFLSRSAWLRRMIAERVATRCRRRHERASSNRVEIPTVSKT
jgi:metal-responsive CopG/Arc/MetJ family transcriptional regulator